MDKGSYPNLDERMLKVFLQLESQLVRHAFGVGSPTEAHNQCTEQGNNCTRASMKRNVWGRRLGRRC